MKNFEITHEYLKVKENSPTRCKTYTVKIFRLQKL